jgi:hypothetical protein
MGAGVGAAIGGAVFGVAKVISNAKLGVRNLVVSLATLGIAVPTIASTVADEVGHSSQDQKRSEEVRDLNRRIKRGEATLGELTD